MPELGSWELLARLALAAALGGLIGFEREISDQPAGFRTHMLVSLGAALFTVVGAYGVGAFFHGNQHVTLDPTRVAAQIVTGIGFLGAGAILTQGVNVRGLTTAAALWVTAAVGTAVGFGYWLGALIATAVTVLALFGLKPVSRRLFRRLRRGQHRFIVEIEPSLRLSELAQVFDDVRARTEAFKVVTDDDRRRHVVVAVRLPSAISADMVADRLSRLEGIGTIDIAE